MAQLNVAYDPRNHEPQKAFEPLPRGDYDVMVVNTEVKRTKAGDGSLLKIELEVQGGPHARRRVFDQITLENPNVQAVEIGQRQLSGLCHAVGWLQPLEDSDVLHGQTCVARVGIEKGDGQYQDKNKVSAYLSPEGRTVTANGGGPARGPAPTQVAQAQPPVSTSAAKTPPWRK